MTQPPPLPAPACEHIYVTKGLGGGAMWSAVPGTPEAAGPPGSLRRWRAQRRARRST